LLIIALRRYYARKSFKNVTIAKAIALGVESREGGALWMVDDGWGGAADGGWWMMVGGRDGAMEWWSGERVE
jgi:hypothetical protein